jgi:hypothetical protein
MKIFAQFLMSKQLKRDRIIFYVWPLFAGGLSLLLRAHFFTSLFLFFGFPALLLCYRNKDKIKKALLFSLSTLIIVVVLDYISDITGVWYITNSVISYRLLGQVTLENIIWLPLYAFFIVMYYEYFYELGDQDVLYTPRLKYLYAFYLAVLTIFLAVYLINKDWLYLPYFYMQMGIVLIILPIILTFFKSPRLFTKLIKVGIYFSFLSLIYELTALYLDQWVFPGGGTLGLVGVGKIRFPVEELVFWIMLGSIGGLSLYEFFDDDEK